MMKSSSHVALIALLTIACGSANATPINASATGLTGATNTLTFDEFTLPVNTAVTNQYAAFGVTFAPNSFYDADAGGTTTDNYPNFSGNYVTDYNVSSTTVINPLTLNFTSVENAADFLLAGDVTPFTFTALLNGSIVDSFTATAGYTSSNDYYGFQNELFNSITITQAGAGGGPYYDIDNIETNVAGTVAATPEPSSILLVCTGLLGAACTARRRFKVSHQG